MRAYRNGLSSAWSLSYSPPPLEWIQRDSGVVLDVFPLAESINDWCISAEEFYGALIYAFKTFSEYLPLNFSRKRKFRAPQFSSSVAIDGELTRTFWKPSLIVRYLLMSLFNFLRPQQKPVQSGGQTTVLFVVRSERWIFFSPSLDLFNGTFQAAATDASPKRAHKF